jgi:hypothetical protein
VALFPVAPQSFAPGEQVVTTAVTIPEGLIRVKVSMDLSAAQLQDPATNVTGTVEHAPDGTEEWTLLAQTRLVGNPDNDPTLTPWIAVSGRTLDQIAGQLVRGRIQNDGVDPITFGGTVEVV